MGSASDQVAKPRGRLLVVLLLFGLLAAVCLGAIYYAGDLSKLQTVVAAREGRTALRGVTDPGELDQAIEQYPSNKLLRLVALANRDMNEIDAAAQKLLDEAAPRPFPSLGDLGAASRDDLDALRRDLKTAEANVAASAARYNEQLRSARENVEKDARSVNVGDERLSSFMAMIDEQHTVWIALASKRLAASADYYNAYEKCAALLMREFGTYRIENGQFVFPFQSMANGYNRAAAAMTDAAKRESELDGERASLRQSELSRWKAFVEQ
ncbi:MULTISPECIES: hypothetical protein [unclassified Bradyrhizobium]|uniref:hypothetical protein n=1 Tax=unclassified Bradyrhizobium TaxID=2631580 RepID=UPI00247A641B|nr:MULTISPECIES: hypothetical protein [unclassified Bradyrhizobium]WGR74662.1 hypothetical protein MTX24_18325 [Bradyrhizobium sp. ISRA426]WGR79497.1 hypothetical protein MTX21_03440 [Bradyrhizobium sp. ISRA430]WGR89834.1 hypothetical protein MTX25_18005 [Bradyrhizobium sp. ISRA432]